MNSAALTMLLAFTLPHTETVQERCEHIEHNIVFDDAGGMRLAQLIFDDRDVVVDWRMTDKTGLPRYDWERKCWIVRWIEDGVIHEVRANTYEEVWSNEDREIVQRLYWPDIHRRKLRK